MVHENIKIRLRMYVGCLFFESQKFDVLTCRENFYDNDLWFIHRNLFNENYDSFVKLVKTRINQSSPGHKVNANSEKFSVGTAKFIHVTDL